MHRRAALALALLLAGVVPPGAQAQLPANFYAFDLFTEDSTTVPIVPGGGAAIFDLVFVDQSRDSTGALAQNPAAPNQGAFVHQVFFKFEFGAQNIGGWSVLTPSVKYTQGGTTTAVQFQVTASLLIQTPVMPVKLIAYTDQGGERFENNITVTVYSIGVQSFNAQPEDIGGEVKPDHIVDIPVRIVNAALLPRGFDIEVTSNPCGMQVATSSNNLVGPKETAVYTISARTPHDKLWYFSENCAVGFEVTPSDRSASPKQLTANVIVNGGYVDPQWVIWLVEILVVLLLLILFLIRRKERIEEELLGKPQKPWTIPVEALYLRALRQKDERAWYVVRHHLMEEEYRSSLLWYKAYKKATKGSRKKEALVLRQEKAYERWKKGWEKDIAKPLKQADRYEAKLQRKLDRKTRKADRKNERAVRSITKKMAAAHAKQVERSLEQWQKQVAKANKKGLEPPPRPVIPEPDYPEEPEPQTVMLADHKWSKKAARFRARRVKEQGNLEVKFEKADARRLAKLRRKVRRLARKLDDPDFVAEHPLLRADA